VSFLPVGGELTAPLPQLPPNTLAGFVATSRREKGRRKGKEGTKGKSNGRRGKGENAPEIYF